MINNSPSMKGRAKGGGGGDGGGSMELYTQLCSGFSFKRTRTLCGAGALYTVYSNM